MTAKEYRATAPKKRNQKKEESLQIQLADWMRKAYPDVIYHSDTAAGMQLTMHQAVKNKRMQFAKGYPDFQILEASYWNGKMYFSLFLELKHSREGVFLKDGSLSKSEHIQTQAAFHELLKNRGYHAQFCCGLDEAKKIISDYLGY